MTDELKPCPCGGAMRWCGDDPNDPHTCHRLTCTACGMQVDYCSDDMQEPEEINDLRALVARKWNTHHSQDVQAAIDAALESVAQAILNKGSVSISADLPSSSGYCTSVDIIRSRINSNPLAEAQARIDALEKQRASLFKEGAEAAVIAAERIKELEGELRSADGLAEFNSNLFTEQARRIAELERELAEARAAIKAEREACAGICDSLSVNGIKADPTGWCAETIRRRSERHSDNELRAAAMRQEGE